MASARYSASIPLPVILAVTLLSAGPALAETFTFAGAQEPGITLRAQSATGVELHFEMGSFAMEPLTLDGQVVQKISMPDVFLPNDAGAPDLPGLSRFVAVPEGATATVTIIAARERTYPNVEVAPAPVIPRENDDSPPVYTKNAAIYGRNAAYPASPVVLSPIGEMRGVDVVTIGLTPFQYNPVTKDLVAYLEIDVRIDFAGGSNVFGEERLRSRYWEPVLEEHLLNYASLRPVDFSHLQRIDGYEYVIICPDHADFIPWADTLAAWRKLEGISTTVVTTTEIGGTTAPQIEAWLNNAYQTWTPAPSAFLILGDFPGSGFLDSGITSPTWNGYCISDNMYADVNVDNLPDMFHGRITARNAAELQTMIGKMLAYERAPYTDPAFYDRPIIAGGWQTERWFILCTEVCFGHQVNALGKNPVREYAIYSGTPSTAWSTATNTGTVVNYFGPNGLGYIPATPSHLTDWGGNATRINADINAGAYMLLHRDHGYENGWGEPAYSTTSLAGLTNTRYPFVFTINCLTGKYNYASECFGERFHRMGYGAVGLIAPSEISYSFVNDTFIWGMWDSMWPEFMPGYGPQNPTSRFATDLRPAFGMANGKYFLQASSWPYNTENKDETHHLFHHHGDTFLRMYSEVPTALAVDHPAVLFIGLPTFTVEAEAGAVVALTVDGEIIGVADATGLPEEIPIAAPTQPGTMLVTITKANRYRYTAPVPIVPPAGPYLVYEGAQVLDASGDDDGILDAGEADHLLVTLENVGIEPTTGVAAALSTADPYVTITTAVQSFPNIPAGGSAVCTAPYALTVAGNCPDGHVVAFTLAITATEGQWGGNFSLPVQAPVLGALSLFTDDSAGNANGRPDPGDAVTLTVTIGNAGHSASPALTGTMTSTHPGVSITSAGGTCPGVPIGGQGTMGTFELQVLPGCPSPTQIPLRIAVGAENGLQAVLDYEMPVGPWFDDAEAERGWALAAPDDNATSGRWIRADPVGTTYNSVVVQTEDDHSPSPGVACFVTGNADPGAAAGTADVDGGKTTLLSPVFDLTNATTATVTYWRWFSNSAGNNPNEDYWVVDATADGTAWVHLENTLTPAVAWTQQSFDLADFVTFTDRVQVRFVASDLVNPSLVEAAVDDITFDIIRAGSAGVAPDAVAGTPRPTGIIGISPNPFNPATTVAYAVAARTPLELTVYDVSGRLVRTLVSGVVAPGEHTTVFDGRNAGGDRLASGIYFLRFDTPERTQVRQLTLVK